MKSRTRSEYFFLEKSSKMVGGEVSEKCTRKCPKQHQSPKSIGSFSDFSYYPGIGGFTLSKTKKSAFHNKKCSDNVSGETLAIHSTHVLRPHTKFDSHPSTLGQVMVSVKSDLDEFRVFGPYWAITRDKFLKPPPNHFR